MAASPPGKCPRVRTARLSFEFCASKALPDDPPDRGTEHKKRADVLPKPPPAECDRRIFLAPGTFLEGVQRDSSAQSGYRSSYGV